MRKCLLTGKTASELAAAALTYAANGNNATFFFGLFMTQQQEGVGGREQVRWQIL